MKLAILIFFAIYFKLSVVHGQPDAFSLVEEFAHKEKKVGDLLSAELMSGLGARALLRAKVLQIESDSKVIKANSIYFRLKNSHRDVCRQVFMNEMKYIVHTKCYRGYHELFNFIEVFSK